MTNRTVIIVILIFVYLILGVYDVTHKNIATGIASLLLAVVNGLLFFAGGK